MTIKSEKSFYSQTITMIDPATGWIETSTVLSVQADLGSNHVKLAWISCYKRHNKVIVDRGNKVLTKKDNK